MNDDLRVNFPIVDTHVHLWNKDKLHYSWLSDIPSLNRNFLLEDYDQASKDIVIGHMVFLQCEADFSQFQDEALWVLSLAEKDDRIKAIIPWAPLEKGDRAKGDIESLAQYSLIKGVRRIIQFEDDPEFCLQPDFIKGVRLLADHNLIFEICISHVHMENTIKFVRQCPDVVFVLDHIGKPDIKNHVLEPWTTQLKTLAELPNVFCKVSGLITEADHEKWSRDDLKPYIEHVINCFGFDRVMFGGDWPVVTLGGEYIEWIKALEWAVCECSENEFRKLFHDNAIRIYNMK